METTIEHIGVMDNGKENGNYYNEVIDGSGFSPEPQTLNPGVTGSDGLRLRGPNLRLYLFRRFLGVYSRYPAGFGGHTRGR